jgi:hypothetical protein
MDLVAWPGLDFMAWPWLIFLAWPVGRAVDPGFAGNSDDRP